MTTDETSLDDIFGSAISPYSRAQAIEGGVLIDVTGVAREAGFKWSTALTQGAWRDCVAWTERDSRIQTQQDESGRLWDVLFMAFYAISTATDTANRLHFSLYRVPKDGHSMQAEKAALKLMVGPGDAEEPVITIMLPSED